MSDVESKLGETTPPFALTVEIQAENQSGDVLKTLKVASRLAKNYHLRNFSVKSMIPTDFKSASTESEKHDYGSNLANYLQFSPRYVLSDLLNKFEILPERTDCPPTTSSSHVSLLFADISGFTRLSSILGAEELKIHTKYVLHGMSDIMTNSRYFSMLLSCIEKYKGDVIKFCGDAVMIIWPCPTDAAEDIKFNNAVAAADCGIALVQKCGLYQSGEGANAVELSLHCGLGCGVINSFFVGSSDRREFLISGEVLAEVGGAESEATREQIYATSSAWKYLCDLFAGQKSQTTENVRLLSRVQSGNIFQNFASPSRESIVNAFGNSLSFLTSKSTASRREAKVKPLMSVSPDVAASKTDDDSTVSHSGASCPIFFAEEELTPRTPRVVNAINFDSLSASQKSIAAEVLRSYLHESTRHTIESLGFTHIAELRTVITLFVNVKGLEDDFAIANLDKVQRTMLCALQSFAQFGGALRQFVVDDKGCVIIGSFGLPQFTHEDDGVRAIEAACMIRSSLRHEVGLTCSIGISRGVAFCGLVGTESRCEYAMMGCCVNLAARLMAAAPANEILVESGIYSLTDKSFEFQSLPPIKAKGYVELVPVYRPTCRLSSNLMLSPAASSTAASSVNSQQGNEIQDGGPIFVGRVQELDTLQTRLIQAKEDKITSSVIVGGEVGMGKTKLISQLIPLAESLDFAIWACSGASAHANTAFFTIRQLLSHIFFSMSSTSERLTNESSAPQRSLLRQWSMASRRTTSFNRSTHGSQNFDAAEIKSPSKLSPLKPRAASKLDERVTCVTDWIQQQIGEIEVPLKLDDTTKVFRAKNLASLLAPVLSLGRMDDHESVIMLTSKERDHLRIEFVSLIIQTSLVMQPYLVIFENLEFIDRESQKILHLVFGGSTLCGTGLAIFTTRQLTACQDLKYFHLPESCITIQLKKLLPEELEELVKLIMGHETNFTASMRLEESIIEISEQSNGNPLVVENMAHALRDRMANTSSDSPAGNSPRKLPDTITGVVMERFDKLTPERQLVLKVASVIGNEFPLKILADVCRTVRQDERFGAYRILLDLLDKNFIVRRVCENEAIFSFVHESTKDTIYQLMLKSQKQQFHYCVGDWYLQNKRQDKSCLQTELLHHALAENIPQLVSCTELLISDEFKAFNWERAIFLSQMLIKLSTSAFKAEEVPNYLKKELGEQSPRVTSRGEKLFSTPSAYMPGRAPLPISKGHLHKSIYRSLSTISDRQSPALAEIIEANGRAWLDEDQLHGLVVVNETFDYVKVAEWYCNIASALLHLGELEISHNHCLKALCLLQFPICSKMGWKASIRMSRLRIRVLTQKSDDAIVNDTAMAIKLYSNLASIYLQSGRPQHCFYVCRIVDIILDETNAAENQYLITQRVAVDGFISWLLTDDHSNSVRPRIDWIMNEHWTSDAELLFRNLQRSSGTLTDMLAGEFENDDNVNSWITLLSSWVHVYRGDLIQCKIDLFHLKNTSKWLEESYSMISVCSIFQWLNIMEGRFNEVYGDSHDSVEELCLLAIVESRKNNGSRSIELMEEICDSIEVEKSPLSFQMPIILSLTCLEAIRMLTTSDASGLASMVCMPISWSGRVLSSGNMIGDRLGRVCKRMIKTLATYGKYIAASGVLAAALDIRLCAAQGRVDHSIRKRREYERELGMEVSSQSEGSIPFHVGFYHFLVSKSLLDAEMIKSHADIANNWISQTNFGF